MNSLRELLRISTPSVQRQSSLLLFDFSQPQVIASINTGSDESTGGFSRCTFRPNEDNTGAVFEGHISLKMPLKSEIPGSNFFMPKRRVIKTGFAACSGPINWVNRLGIMNEFDAIEVVGRGDSNYYKLNIRPESYSRDDLYQCLLQFDDDKEWKKRTITFDKLTLTGLGKVKEIQREFDHGRIETVGFSISDNQAGPFKLELKSVHLINTQLIDRRDKEEDVDV